MPNDLSMIFNVISRDGASPVFKTVAAEAKALAATMADADAKMTASSRAAAASVSASMAELGRAHTATALQYDRATTQEIGANDSLELSQQKLAASMQALVAEQRAAAASAVEMGATVDRVAAEEAAATEASAAKRKASMAVFGAASAAALAGVAYYSVKAATSFEASMARVQTMAGASATELKHMSDGVLALAPKVGVGPDKLAESLYHVESAGFQGAKALDMVAASAKLSALGQDDINSSTQAVVATLASNIKGVRDANDAAALILHTVGTGDMTMHQFTQALGTGLLATAAAVGLSFQDVGAAIATMTDNAIPADQAATKLRTSLLMMVNPTGPAIAALNSVGMNATQLAADLQKPAGLKVALDDIRTHLDAAFPKNGGVPLTIGAQRAAIASYRQELATAGVQGKELDKAVANYTERLKTGTTNTVLQEQAFAKMFGGSKNAGTMMVLFNEQLDRMDPKLASFGDATSRAAQMQSAWAKQQSTFKQQLNDLGASVDVAKIKIGNALLPVLKDMVGFMADHVGMVKAFAVVIGTTLVAATVAWTVSLQSNPVVLLVEAIVGLGVALYELVTHFNEVSQFLSGKWGTAISIAVAAVFPFIGIPMLIMGHWRGIVGFFKGVWDGITHPIATVKRAWDDLIGGFQNPQAIFGKAVEGFDHLFLSIGEHIRRLPGDVFHFGELIGRAWGRMLADVPHWVGDLFSAISHVDWGHVASVIGDALLDAVKAIWRNKTKIAEIGLAIVGGIAAAVFAIPAALTALGVILVGGIVVGIAKGLAGAAGAVGRFFERMWHDAAGFASRMANDVGGFFSRMWKDVSGFAGRIWSDVTGFFARMGHDIAQIVSNDVDLIGRHWRLLLVIFTGPLGFLIDTVNHFWHAISGFFERIWHDVSGFTARMWRDVTGYFTRMNRDVAQIATRMWKDVSGFAARIWRDVSGWFSRMWKDVAGITARIAHDVAGWFSRMWHDVSTFAARIWHDVAGFFERMWRDVTGFTGRIWHDVTGWFSRMWRDLANFASRIWHDVTGWFSKTRDDTVSTSTDLWHKVIKPFQSLWDGLKAGFNDAVGAIKTAWDKLHDIFAVPIKFLVKYVYNDAIVPVWNGVAGIIGEKELKINKVDLHGWAQGGGTSGPWRGDDRIIKVGGNEHIWTAEEVDAAGGHSRVAAIRSAILGRPVRVMGDGPNAGYASGGGVLHALTHNPVTDAAGSVLHAVTHNPVTDALGDVAGAVAGFVRGAIADGAGPILNGAVSLLARLVPNSGAGWGKASVDMGHGLVNHLMDWIRGQDARDSAAMGGLAGGSPIDWNGGPVTVGLIEKLARTLPGGNAMTVTSTTGGGHAAGSYHYKGEAVDFSNGTGNTPQMLAFDRAWAAKYGSSLAELIYTAPGSVFIKDGSIVGPGTYSSVLDEHRNHVHVAISPQSIARGHNSFSSFIGSSGMGPAAEGSIVQQVHAAAAARGWGGQLGDLDYVVGRESGWNPAARNPSSTASGLFQLLYNAGSTVSEQIRNGFDYLAGRYGDPANAAAHERSYGWYANGGMPPVGQPFWVGERGPELMRLGPAGRGSRVYSNEESRKMTGGSLMHVENMHVNSQVDLDLGLRNALFLRETAGTF